MLLIISRVRINTTGMSSSRLQPERRPCKESDVNMVVVPGRTFGIITTRYPHLPCRKEFPRGNAREHESHSDLLSVVFTLMHPR